jgi:hypothetical protein
MEEKFEIFALISLFGHKRLAGKVTLMNLGNSTLLRVDIPETKLIPAFTKFINPSAIYTMDPITSELMQTMAESIKEQPIESYNIMDVMKKMKVALAERGERSDLIDEYDHSAED